MDLAIGPVAVPHAFRLESVRLSVEPRMKQAAVALARAVEKIGVALKNDRARSGETNSRKTAQPTTPAPITAMSNVLRGDDRTVINLIRSFRGHDCSVMIGWRLETFASPILWTKPRTVFMGQTDMKQGIL